MGTTERKAKQVSKMQKTMRTKQYRIRQSDKLLMRTRDWPEIDEDAKYDPELSWVRLLKGRRFDDVCLYINDIKPRSRVAYLAYKWKPI